ncbi:MAG: YfcC family protein [Eisenbergiella sp.]
MFSQFISTVDAAGVTFFVFISYASIGLIIASGAFNGLVASMLRILKGSARAVIIPVFITLIGCASSTIGVFEEMFPFIPIFVGIAIAMGYDAIVGLAIVALGTGLGYSGAVMNPFTVGMAQSIADVPQMSGAGYRIICHIILIAVASFFVIRYALKIQADPTKSLVYGDDFSSLAMDSDHIENKPFGIREKLVLATLVAGIVVIVWGTKAKGWYFAELSAVFLLMGLVSGFIMGWGPNEIAEKVAASPRLPLLYDDRYCPRHSGGSPGRPYYRYYRILPLPLSNLPGAISAIAMFLVQTGINFFIPSGSGQAVTSMPIMAPLADLIGISRQSAVLAFQFGDGLSNIAWPTAMTPIICGIAGVKIEKWWKWFVPIFIALVITQSILMASPSLSGNDNLLAERTGHRLQR